MATLAAGMAAGMLRLTVRRVLLGASLAAAALSATPAAAATRHTLHTHHAKLSSSHHAAYHRHHVTSHVTNTSYREGHHSLRAGGTHGHRYYQHTAAVYRHSGLQCVPYAREISHIALSGDAFLWWAEASGRYARGNEPAQGAVLNFRAIGRMPLGHVAVVTAVLDNRTILVTQANWVRGTITNDVTVQDVSPENDWSQVKVELGDSNSSGAPYPTYGFIYNRPDTGTVIAANGLGTEVAEAPPVVQVSDEAPNRNLQ